MKPIALCIIFALVFFNTAFAVFFNLADGQSFFFLESTVWAYIFFVFFIAHIVTQFVPGIAFDTQTNYALTIASALYIPLIIMVFALSYRSIGIEGAETQADYLYFSIVTFTTLGYGDLTPSGTARIYANLQAICGFLFVPLIISQLIRTTEDVRADDDVEKQVRGIINEFD